jgi:hypothetical protein
MQTTWRGAVKKLVTTTLSLALVAAPAAAQIPGQGQGASPSLNLLNDGFHLKTDVEVNEERERERAYKSGMSKIPDQNAKKNDPWGAVRTTPPTASNQRPATK